MRRLFATFALALSAAAQEPLTLEAAVQRALDSHPLLAEGRQRVESARGQLRQAGLTFNPRLILQAENYRAWGARPIQTSRETDDFAYLQQTFETAGKRGKRVELASRGLRAAELELDVLRRNVAREVSLAYWAALGATKIHEILLESVRNFEKIVEYHEIRVREGAMAENDLLRVRLELGRIQLATNNAGLDAAKARIELFRAMGQTVFPEIRFADPLQLSDDRPLPADEEEALRRRPEMQLALARLEQARGNVVVQRANATPNLDALFGYKRSMGEHTLIAGLQWDLPVLNRNQGNVQSAAAEVRAAEANLAATEAIIRAEVRAAAAEYQVRRQQLRELVGRLRSEADQTSKIAQSAYRLGGADLLRLLDAERLRIEIEQVHYRAWMEYRQSMEVLEFALGVKP
ncbi:MAG: metal transporter [Bryobacteraceae bacterium]|nr:MAG: metal transporter [Bryobacteraceae bacterium]